MTVVVGEAQKGGTGKSTSLIHFAHGVSLLGKSACIVDTDEQATVLQFERDRNLLKTDEMAKDMDLSYPLIQGVSQKQPYRDFINKIRDRFDYIFIDTKGEFTQFQYDLTRLSDVVICPISPSKLDLRPAMLVNDAVKQENTQREVPIKLFFHISKATYDNNQKVIVRQIKEELKCELIEPYTRNSSIILGLTGIGLTIFDVQRNFKQAKALLNRERLSDEHSSMTLEQVNKVANEILESCKGFIERTSK